MWDLCVNVNPGIPEALCASASATLARRARRSWAERPASRVACLVVNERGSCQCEISQAHIFSSRVGEAHAPLGLARLGYGPF